MNNTTEPSEPSEPKQWKIGARVSKDEYDRVARLCSEVRAPGGDRARITDVVRAIVMPTIEAATLARLLALKLAPHSTLADRVHAALLAGLQALERGQDQP